MAQKFIQIQKHFPGRYQRFRITMNPHSTILIETLYQSFVTQNWNDIITLLSTNPPPLHDPDELIDAFENFLFRIDVDVEDLMVDETTVDQIIQLFLRSINMCSPQFIPKDRPLFRHFEDTTLIHNLCIENKHEALALLLRNLDPRVAATEVQRVAHIRLDFIEDINGQEIYHDLDVWHTPIQIAWAGKLFDKQSLEILKDVSSFDDLTEEWRDLWVTTVYLLLAFDGKPINLDYATASNWNVLNVIARYGHRNYDAVMLLALKLYPQFAQAVSPDGNLPIHEATKNQICYRKDSRELQLRVELPDVHQRHNLVLHRQSSPPQSANQINLPIIRMKNPTLLLLERNESAAYARDKNGRLPLHLALLYYQQNRKRFVSMKRNECDSHHAKYDYELDSIPVIEGLVAMNPQALECVEPSTGLNPFLLAASGDTCGLDVVFSLLSHNPAVLVNSTSLTESDSHSLSPSEKLPKTSKSMLTTCTLQSKQRKRVVSPLMWSPPRSKAFRIE